MSEFFAADLDTDFAAVDTTGQSGREPVDMRGRFTNAADAFSYMTAGKATVTFVSKASGVRFTYRLTQSEDGQCYFVGLLSGPDNTSDYQYMGYIRRDIYRHGRKVARPGDITMAAPSAKAFAWSWQQLAGGRLPEALEVWHEGRCGRCARKLTVPSSVARGFGPECAEKMGFPE